MFENISFLFLFAMALFSWAVLCLQHAVEIQRRSASDVELYTERPGITFKPHVFHKSSEPSPLIGVLDFSMSFWVILVLAFGLTKLVLLVERKAKNYLKGRESLKLVNLPKIVESRSLIQEYPAEEQKLPPDQQYEEFVDAVSVEENIALKEQLSVLQSHCSEMRELLHELRLSKSSSSQESVQFGDEGVVEHSEESMMVREGVSSLTEAVSTSPQPLYRIPESLTTGSSHLSQNIYITNNHIHIGGPVFCSDNLFSMELCRQASMYAWRQSEFLQVWGTYITGPKERPMIAGRRCNNILL